MTQRVCLISPGHVSSNPRLVKEADALVEAGYHVRVVAADYFAPVRELDSKIYERAKWDYRKVRLPSQTKRTYYRLIHTICRVATNLTIPLPKIMRAWAHSTFWYSLAKAAAEEQADLYIAHNLAALAAAHHAAEQHRSYYGFDAEDFHTGELPDLPEHQKENNIRYHLEKSFLPGCSHLTAAAPEIANAYLKKYGQEFTTILNVFPKSEFASSSSFSNDLSADAKHKLYWFSQTVGPGRGLEFVLQSIGQMESSVELYLRGLLSDKYRESLTDLAQKEGILDRINFLPLLPADELIDDCSNYSIGLATEMGHSENRRLCLTNKIFTYLSAGIPILLSETPAQVSISKDLGAAAILTNIENTRELARALDEFLSSPKKIATARLKSNELATTIYNWDLEQRKFLDSVGEALSANTQAH